MLIKVKMSNLHKGQLTGIVKFTGSSIQVVSREKNNNKKHKNIGKSVCLKVMLMYTLEG